MAQGKTTTPATKVNYKARPQETTTIPDPKVRPQGHGKEK